MMDRYLQQIFILGHNENMLGIYSMYHIIYCIKDECSGLDRYQDPTASVSVVGMIAYKTFTIEPVSQ